MFSPCHWRWGARVAQPAEQPIARAPSSSVRIRDIGSCYLAGDRAANLCSTGFGRTSMLGSMRASLVPLLVTVTGVVVYQISSKSVPREVHPLVAIIGAYLTAIGLCLLA